MTKESAGLLLFRRGENGVEVFLIHPGGPYWANRDAHAWSIPKGEPEDDEELLAAARREFHEETGACPETSDPIPLAPCRQSGGKIVNAWAVEGDQDAGALRSNTFDMEWPPNSGQIQAFPEADRAAWFTLGEGRAKLHKYLLPLLDEFERHLSEGGRRNGTA